GFAGLVSGVDAVGGLLITSLHDFVDCSGALGCRTRVVLRFCEVKLPRSNKRIRLLNRKTGGRRAQDEHCRQNEPQTRCDCHVTPPTCALMAPTRPRCLGGSK